MVLKSSISNPSLAARARCSDAMMSMAESPNRPTMKWLSLPGTGKVYVSIGINSFSFSGTNIIVNAVVFSFAGKFVKLNKFSFSGVVILSISFAGKFMKLILIGFSFPGMIIIYFSFSGAVLFSISFAGSY